MIKNTWFYIQDNYHSGPKLHTQDDYEDEHDGDEKQQTSIPHEAFYVNFELPTPENKWRMYIVNGHPAYDHIWSINANDCDDEDYEKIYLKLYLQIYGCMPHKMSSIAFASQNHNIRTGLSHIQEFIKNMNEINIDEKIIDEISNEKSGEYYFIYVVDSNGRELMSRLI